MQFLNGVLGDQVGTNIGNILGSFNTAWSDRSKFNDDLLNQQMAANAAKSGIGASPAAADIAARGLAQQNSQTADAYAQQTMPFALNLMGLVNNIHQAQLNRDWQANQAELQKSYGLSYLNTEQGAAAQMARDAFQRQMDMNRQNESLQELYQKDMIPINVQSFNASTDAYRAKYPNWNQDPTAQLNAMISQMGGGQGGAGGGGGYNGESINSLQQFVDSRGTPGQGSAYNGPAQFNQGAAIGGAGAPGTSATPYTYNATQTGQAGTGFNAMPGYTPGSMTGSDYRVGN